MKGRTLLEVAVDSPEKNRFYEWSFPGAPVRVRLKLELIPKILGHLVEGSDPDSKVRKECGGILLGGIEGNCVEICDFEPFVNGQQVDPFFVLKDSDKVGFQKAVDRWKQSGTPFEAVGLCRSHMHDTLSLHEHDVSLFDAVFPNPFHVFLLVQPAGSDGWPVAAFFFRDGGNVFTESVLPFPFNQAILETEVRSTVWPASELEDRPSLPALAQTSTTSTTRRAHYPILALTALILSVLALASTFYPGKKASPPSLPYASPLILSVQPSSGGLAINWDAASPVIKNARVGMLSFQNETKREEVPLSVSTLRTGQFVYRNEAKTLQVMLEVFSAEGERTRELVLISNPDPPAAIDVAQTTGPSPSPNTVSAPKAAGERAPHTPPPQFELPQRKQPTPISVFAMEPPPLERRQAQQSQVPPLLTTAITPGPPLAAPLPPESSKERPGPVSQAAAPEVVVTPEPSTPTPLPVPPKPIQQVRPELPGNVRHMLQSEVVVQVRVMVDADGRVIKATPLPTKSTIAEYAGQAAAKAIRLWRFEPSYSGSQPVPGELTLEFRFAPAPKR